MNEPPVITGHPTLPLLDDHGDQIDTVTVCGNCGELRTILILTGDRWYCSKCRAEGRSRPNLYPVA